MKRSELKFPVRASQLWLIADCPGSARMCAGLPNLETEASKEGVRLHKYVAKLLTIPEDHWASYLSDLPDDHKWMVIFALEKAQELTDQLFENPKKVEKLIETTLPFDAIDDFGTADYAVINVKQKVGLIIDFKFGRVSVESTENNLQIRAYAVGLAQKYRLKTVYTAIVQPRDSEKVKGPVKYTKDDLIGSEAQIQGIIEASQHYGAPLKPSPSCTYCPASSYCVAAQAESERFSLAVQKNGFILEKPEEMAHFVKMGKTAIKLIEERLAKITEYVASGGTIPGYEYQAGRMDRKIVNTSKTKEALKEYFSDKEFEEISKVSVSDLEKLVHKNINSNSENKVSQKAVREMLEATLMAASAIDFKRQKGFLKEVKNV